MDSAAESKASGDPAVLNVEKPISEGPANGMAYSGIEDEDGLEGLDDNDLGRKGIAMMIENNWVACEALFEKYKGQSSLMGFGWAFVSFMKAALTQEADQLEKAKAALEEIEKRCSKESGFVKLRRKIKGKASPLVLQEDRWLNDIVQADVLFCRAVATFMAQELPSYIKGGWLMRKAWKIYERVYKEINSYYQRSLVEGDIELVHSTKSKGGEDPSAVETLSVSFLKRMYSAVCYGYGLFQLVLSMIPDKMLKLIEFLGFAANKEEGLKALAVCSESSDMRAPLAMLAQLWYHTIMKPMFANNNELSKAELEETAQLFDLFEPQYPKASVLLFFKGRFHRLQKDVDLALVQYEAAHSMSAESREMQLAVLFEIAWCNLLKLNFSVGAQSFGTLSVETKWSKAFNKYMQALCEGSLGNVESANKLMEDVLPLIEKKKGNPIEMFVQRRAMAFKKSKLTQMTSELHVAELLYLWNNFPQCSQETLEKILSVCGQQEDRNLFHIRSLIEGAVHKQLGDEEFGLQCIKESLAHHDGMKYDHHIAAHALFEQGMVWVTRPEMKKKGKQSLMKAKDSFKEYDFENRLNIRIKAALKDL